MAPYRGHLFIGLVSLSIVLAGICSADNADLKALKKTPVPVDFNDIVKAYDTADDSTGQDRLRIAVAAMISPKDTYKYYIDLLNLIGELMDRKITFIQKKTYSEINSLLRKEVIDLAFICSGPYVSGKKAFDLEILVVPFCHGAAVYYSYFIALKKSEIYTFSDLRGKTFAFTDPLSNTGYLVPTYFVALRGESVNSYFGKTFFTHSHDNSIQAVADGLADGAAVDSLIFEFLTTRNPDYSMRLKIIEKSEPYGIPPVVVPLSIDPNLKARLKRLFLSIHNHPQGKEALEKLQIERFVEGDDKAYDSVRRMHAYLSTAGR